MFKNKYFLGCEHDYDCSTHGNLNELENELLAPYALSKAEIVCRVSCWSRQGRTVLKQNGSSIPSTTGHALPSIQLGSARWHGDRTA